jgi:hypothetical protein
VKQIVCEVCGSNDFTKAGDLFVCDFCSTKYSSVDVEKMMIEGTVEVAGTVRVDRTSETHNLISLATAALDNSNANEAYDYANRALEIDTDDPNAWVVKGKAAGWSSTINNFRVPEMLGAFRRAEELTPSDERERLRQECADTMNGVAVAVHNLSWNFTNEHVRVDGVWAAHITRCEQIVTVLQIAYEWGEKRAPLDNIVIIVSNLIRGITFKAYNGASSSVFLQKAYQQKMQQLLETAATDIRNFDPAYKTPHPKKSGSCFVVTATMGDESAFPVVTLRSFRDEVLADYANGRRFIQWYELNGPRMADPISESRLLRAVSLMFIIAPSTAFAWVLMKGFRRQALEVDAERLRKP